MTFKRVFLTGVALLASLEFGAAVTPLYVNEGTLTEVPQVDAQVFVNHGFFSVSSPLPYQTQNTLIYTNTGTMISPPGFDFGTISDSGLRTPASLFYNDLNATVATGIILDLAFPIFQTDPTTDPAQSMRFYLFSAERPQIRISAENIINRGYFRAGSAGVVHLEGGKIDLTRSGVSVETFPGGQGSHTPTNYFPETGINDSYWGMDDASGADNRGVPTLSPGGVASLTKTGVRATAPPHQVTNAFRSFGYSTLLTLTNATAFVITNAVTPTNWLVQVVLVQNRDTNMTTEVKFISSTIPTNSYKTPVVKLSTKETNVIDAASFLREIYISDFMASETNFTLMTNLVTTINRRPSTYDVARVAPLGYLSGGATNAVFLPTLLANPGYSNKFVTNIYSGYGFQVANAQLPAPNLPDMTVTNLDSRVEIFAKELNLNRTRIRSDGAVVIKAETLLPSSNTAIDSENIVLDVANPSGTLKIQNLIEEFVQRTAGGCYLWSAMWTNLLSGPAPPPPADPAAPPEEAPVIEIGFHVMVVDSQLMRNQPVNVKDFRAKSDEVVINDVIRATDSFVVDASKVVIGPASRVSVGAAIQRINSSNFPRLKSIEINGSLLVPGSEILGSDRGVVLDQVVNHGTNIAFNFDISAAYFENTGVILTDTGATPAKNGTFTLNSGVVKLDGGKIVTGAETVISGTDLKMRNVTISTPDTLTLRIQNSVSDGGIDATNIISAQAVHLLVKPATGDFLGTTITSTIPKFLAVPFTWAGEDRGVSQSGYANNAALNRLVLDGGQDSLFLFRGVSPKNALYVDFLEFKGNPLSDVKSALEIASNLVIYFADSNITPSTLDGLFKDAGAPEGRLRWVKDYAGPASAVDVPLRSLNKSTVMNRALRESMTIDSDGDGIVNGLDAYPLDADSFLIKAQSVGDSGATTSVSLTWSAASQVVYTIEYTTDLASGLWYQLETYVNSAKTEQSATVQVRVSPGESQRYYRIRAAQ
jgi:hypothetical protein